MKQEQYKEKVLKYLEKTLNHTFSYEDNKLFKLIKVEDKFYIYDEKSYLKKKTIDIDYYLSIYKSDAKCVIKHMLFLNKKLKAIKNTSEVKEKISLMIS